MWVLWILLGLVVLGIVIFILIVGFPPKPVTIGTEIPTCSQPLESLPDVKSSQFESCYTLNGNPDPQRYYDIRNDWTVLPLNPQVVPSAQQVCLEFCPQVQLPSSCLTEDSLYLSCLNKLAPTGCSDPAIPVAKSGSLEYYAIGRGKVSCY
jgi:hypothetical protein